MATTGQPRNQPPAELLPLLQAARQADDLYKASGGATALNQLIEIWRALTSSPSFARAPDDFRSATLNALAFALHRRFIAMGRQEDLDAAIEHEAQAIQLTEDKAPQLAGRLTNQGAALMARYGISQQLEDLDAAIETLRRIERVTDHVDRPVFLTNLVSALRTRYDRTQEAVDLDAVIDACSLADGTPPDNPPPAEILQCLADSLYIRFQLSNRPTDLDLAIDTTRQALSTISDAQPPLSLPHFLINLADALYTRFEQRRDVADLDGCIESFRAALARISDSEPLKYSSLGFLGKALRQRYSARGEVADLDEAIASLSRATELAGPRLNDQPRYRIELADDLASSLTARSEATSSIKDLKRAIDIYGSVDTDAPGAAERVSLLGAGLARLYERNGDLDCLTRAIEAQERAVGTLPAGAPGLPGALSNLAAVLGLRYERLGKEFDVSKAIEVCERGLADPALSDDDNHAALLNNLGNLLSKRYARHGNRLDLDRAIEALRGAVNLQPRPSPNVSSRLSNLGTALRMRFTRTGDMGDLEDAIRAHEEAVTGTPTDSSELPMHLGNLATALSNRVHMTHARADLERLLEMSERAMLLTPAGSPELPRYLATLGFALLERGGPRDRTALQRAGPLLQRALELMPAGAPERPRYLHGLGRAVFHRFLLSGAIGDLNAAIDLERVALSLTGLEASERPSMLASLATSLGMLFHQSEDLAAAEEADRLFRESCVRALELEPSEALSAAQSWGTLTAGREAWTLAAEAYGFGLQAMTALFQRQALRQQKEAWLRQARDITAPAAYAMAKAGKLVEAAVAIERGRALLLSEAVERDRADLEGLDRLGLGDLGRRYEEAARRIAALEALQGTPEGEDKPSTQSLRSARGELSETIAEIRRVPDYEHFLDLPGAPELAEISADQPIIYLAAAENGGLGLVVHGQIVKCVWLPELSEHALRQRAGTYVRAQSEGQVAFVGALDQLTSWLWSVAMGPLLIGLDGAPAVTLVPAGILGLVPLHAAWTTDDDAPTGRRYAIDAAEICYAPNGRVLREARRALDRNQAGLTPRLLSVGNPQPVPQHIPLPGAALEAKAAAAAFVDGKSLIEGDALLESVQTALPDASHFHFACHAGANLDVPLNGGLVLVGDRMLTVGQVISLRLSARLAVLSACETALAGTDLPDEVISLPTAMLQAGLSGVVGSLWPVSDVRTIILMVGFYKRMREPGRRPAEALRQAQRWLRDSTNGSKRDLFESWLANADDWPPAEVAEACYEAVVLEPPSERSFAAADGWAAFAFYGA